MQAAISAQYSALQRFGQHISAAPDGSAAVSATADSLLLVLSDACVLREAALSAAAALWMAATLPAAAPAPLALEFVSGMVQHRLAGAAIALEEPASGADAGRSFVREHWEQQVRAAPREFVLCTAPIYIGIRFLPRGAHWRTFTRSFVTDP